MPLYRLRRNRGLDRRGPGRARVGVTVLLPGSERDALEMLAAADGDAVPIAGATDLLVSWPGRLEDHRKTYVDLSGLAGLRPRRWTASTRATRKCGGGPTSSSSPSGCGGGPTPFRSS